MSEAAGSVHVTTPDVQSRTTMRRLVATAREQPWSSPVIVLFVGGIAALGALGWTRANRMEAIAVAILVAGAALTSGAILGFLFGIPRAVQESTGSGPGSGQLDEVYRVNTNLEQISDWLTKIIVGVGLIEVTRIPGKFMGLSEYIASAFGAPAIPSSLAAVALTYFAITGFLGAYLWTRLLLTLEFTRADRAARESPAFYEGLVEALLYQPAPDGFEAAIERGLEFMRRYGQGNWRIWRSMASAYGQKASFLKLQESPDENEISRTRDEALRAVKRVLFLNPDERESVRSLWDPKRATPEENDLIVFANDEEFRSLLEPLQKNHT